MDEHRLEGATRESVGRMQQAYGEATGDAVSQVKGRANRILGVAQNAYGQAADRARDTDLWVSANPWPAAGVAAAIGLIVGLIIAS
jgi:ElaB/YqjD/DUF883 family membrane-anchored ribosome-binding protein